MHSEFEWLRIALAVGLMALGFIVLPAFFLWRDNRIAQRQAEVAHDHAYEHDHGTTP
jgi:hypothetical protein